MKRNRWIPAFAAVALVGVWSMTGCNTPSSTTANDELLTRTETVNLNDAYGGYNFGDESPMFSDALLASDYSPDHDRAYDDPMANDPTVVDINRRPHTRRYLMITWGNLDADSSIDFVTDWSGSLSVDNGVTILKRTVFFDSRDEILPRTSRGVIRWISHTRPHFDGIIVALHKIGPHDSTTVDSTHCGTAHPLSVTFDTGPLTMTFTEDELADLHMVVPVDDAGNAVSFNTLVLEPSACAGGFLAGQWKNVPNRPGGMFRGKWVSNNGVHMGYLKGVFGANDNGDHVFFGKWINRGGKFEGLLKGRYGDFDARPGGWFRGVWLNRQLHVKGGLHGVWRTSDRIDGGGSFRGRWMRACR